MAEILQGLEGFTQMGLTGMTPTTAHALGFYFAEAAIRLAPDSGDTRRVYSVWLARTESAGNLPAAPGSRPR